MLPGTLLNLPSFKGGGAIKRLASPLYERYLVLPFTGAPGTGEDAGAPAGSDFLAGSAAAAASGSPESEAIKAVPALKKHDIKHRQRKMTAIIAISFASIYKYT
jgi:hypothetical protein